MRQMKCAQESASTVTEQVKQRWLAVPTASRVAVAVAVAVARVGNCPATARVVAVLVVVEQGLHLLMGNGFHRAQQEREAIELLIGKRCEALVVHSKALDDEELID